MKRIILLLISFVITVSANAEKKTHTYQTEGKSKTVYVIEKDTVCVFISGGQQAKSDPFFFLEGKKQINSFRQSLIKMKDIYMELIADPEKKGIRGIPVSFDTFLIGWITDSDAHIGRSTNMKSVYAVIDRGNSISHEIRCSGQIPDIVNSQFTKRCFLTFISEDEIQSLIDVLPMYTEEELLSDPVRPNVVVFRGNLDDIRERYNGIQKLAREMNREGIGFK